MATDFKVKATLVTQAVAALLASGVAAPSAGQEAIGSSVVAHAITAATAPFYPAARADVTLTPSGVWVSGVVDAPSACDSMEVEVATDGGTLQMTLVVRTPRAGCSNTQNPVALGYRACLTQPALQFRFLSVRSRVAEGPRTPPEVLRNEFEELGRFDLEGSKVAREAFTPFGECGARSVAPSMGNRVGLGSSR